MIDPISEMFQDPQVAWLLLSIIDDIYCCILMCWSFITGFPTVIDAADCPRVPLNTAAEYEMNRRSSPRLTVTQSCVNGQFSHWALLTGTDKPVYVFIPNALLLLQSSPALAALTVFCVFCDALLLSHYIVCSSWENTSLFFLHPFSQST